MAEKTQDQDSDENGFDTEIDLDNDVEESVDDTQVANQGRVQRISDNYLKRKGIAMPEDMSVVVPEKNIEQVAKLIDTLSAGGTLSRLIELSGHTPELANEQMAILNHNSDVSYDSYESMTQTGQAANPADNANLDHDTKIYTQSQVKARGKDFEDHLINNQRAVRLLPGEGLLKNSGYRHTAPNSANGYVKKFVSTRLTEGEDKDKHAMGAILRQVAERGVITTHRSEGQAWMTAADNYIEATRQADAAKKMAQQEKAGLTFASIDRKDLVRAHETLEASGSREPIVLHMNGKDAFKLAHNEMPAITAKVDSMAEPLANELAKGKPKKALLSKDSITAALSEMNEGETKARIVISGESVVGLTGQIRVKDVAKEKTERFDARAPDVL